MISYAVTICDEFEESIKLLTLLLNYKSEDDEVVVLLDKPKAPKELIDYLEVLGSSDKITLVESIFDGDFAKWKNFLNSYCKQDWIFQLDADELLDQNLVVNLQDILKKNEDKDLIFVPRINIVEGITDEHITKWNWIKDERGFINFPDYQSRLYKNSPKIIWSGKVHERITGFESYTNFPANDVYCLKHIKDIKRQEKQNDYYNTL